MAINVIQPEHGALAVSVSDGVATIAATPDAGYRLDWVKAESGGELLEVVDMAFEVPEEGDVDVSGAFAAEDVPTPAAGQHFIDAAYSNGEVRFEVGGSAVVAAYAGDAVDIIASPFVGYELGAITGADVSGMRFTMPDADVALSIQFVQTDFAVACGEFVQADVATAHAGDTVTAVPTGLDDGQVFLGFIVECPELGVCAWALDVVIEFEMPPYDVTVRQMTEAEAAEYAQAIEDEGETGSGDEQERDDSDVDDEEERDTGTLPHDTVPDPSVTPFTPEDAEQGIPGETQPDAVPAVPDIHEDVPTKTITTYIDEIISDFSAASLAAYEAAGAVAIAVYEDGTEAQVPWSSVEDPAQEGTEAVNEAWAVANATNQHFWHRATKPTPDDGAGTGAFVTDEAQDDFLAAIAAGTEPTTARPLHNLLMNAEGILLRAAKRIRAAFLPSRVEFYDGQGNEASNVVAKFGSDGFQVGETGKSHLVGDYHSLQLIDKEGNTYFHVSDLRNAEGVAEIHELFKGNGSEKHYPLGFTATSNDYFVNVSDGSGGGISKYPNYFIFETAPSKGAEIEVVYETTSSGVKAYTLGTRSRNAHIGAFSVAEGIGTTASGRYSHAEGEGTTASEYCSHAEGYETRASNLGAHAEGLFSKASGTCSHAEGNSTKATGYSSHAEGYLTEADGDYSHAEGYRSGATDIGTHAEGNSWALGEYAHSEGYQTTAVGDYSHAQNQFTSAPYTAQTAIGRYNDSSFAVASNLALMVGNGTATGARSNALTVDWSGNVRIAGSIQDMSGASLYLPLSGGTLTGQLNGTNALFSGWVQAAGTLGFGNGAAGTQYVISAKTPSRNGRIIFVGGGKKADGDANGTVVGLGAGGLTVVGGGEYANNRYNVGDLNDGDEQLYLGADNSVFIETGGNTIANRNTFEFTSGGHFIMTKGKGIEAGNIIDFHTAGQADGTDFMARIQAAETGSITLFPTDRGYAASTNDPRAQWVFQQDRRLAVRRFDGSEWSAWNYYGFGNAGRIEASGPFTMNTNLSLGTAANVHPIEALDSSGVIIAQNRVGVTADRRSYNYLVARQGTSSSGGIKQASFGIQCDSSGTATYHVTNPENFRSAIGLGSLATKSSLAKADIPALDYLPLSGGTLTDHLYLASGKILYAKNTTHDVAASSLSAQTDQNVAVCLDKNSNATAGILSRQLTTGEVRGIFQARHNNASGTAVWNALQLGVKPDGTRTVTLSDEAPWLSALGLGSTTTATSGVVTAASGWTVVLQSLASWGRVRMLHLRVKNASATSGTRKVATLAAAHKPKGPDAAIATMYSPTSGSGYVNTSGEIFIGGSLAADVEWNGMFMWLV